MEEKINRFAPLAGIAFIVLAVASFAIQGVSVDLDDPPAEVMAEYADNDTMVIIGSGVAVIAAALFVLFAAHVAGRLRDAGSRLFSTIAIAGGVITAAGIGVDSALRFAMGNSAGDIDPAAFQALYAAWDGFFWPMHLGAGLVALAAGLASFDVGLLPAPVAGLGILAGVLLIFVPVLAVAIAGLIGFALWTIISGIVLMRRPAPAA